MQAGGYSLLSAIYPQVLVSRSAGSWLPGQSIQAVQLVYGGQAF